MLESFIVDTFRPHVGDWFRAYGDVGSDAVEIQLLSATETAGAAERAPEGALPHRRPFSLVFLGPPQTILPQRIYRIAHATLGEFDLFLVPIGRDASGVQYEAVFT